MGWAPLFPHRDQFSDRSGEQDEKKLGRRPSKRQQEKAPEGKGPHPEVQRSNVNGAGPAPAESRFHEDI